MKIIYFTTALEKEDYESFVKNWRISLNSSIQSLHNRLIRSLALTHEVEVISARPFSKKYCTLKKLDASNKQEGKITWHYLKIKNNKISRFISARRQAKKILANMNLKDSIILTDTLNPYLLTKATALAKKYHLPIIGICNNTPSGIHDTDKAYTLKLLNNADNLSGYIALTNGLNELYNERNRASLVIEGVLENKAKTSFKNDFPPYLYYDGRLDDKSGIYELIKAFNLLEDAKIHLVISGYHANENKIQKAIANNERIHYLGFISHDETLFRESHAELNVCPRPYSEDYDRYLIPDNIIDYLATPVLLVSVKNNRLNKYFENDVIWLNSNNPEELAKGINKGLKMSQEEKNNMIKKANIDVNKLYAMNVINRKIILFLRQFLKQKD